MLKIKHFRGNGALHGIGNAKAGTFVKEDLVVLLVAPTAERVGQNVGVSGEPLGLPFEVMADLRRSEMARHLQTNLMTCAAILEEVEAS